MIKPCLSCGAQQQMVTELLRIYQDGDPIRMMEILVDAVFLSCNQGLVSPADLIQVSHLHHLLAEIARQRELDAQLALTKTN